MKRIISIFIVCALMLSLSMVAASAGNFRGWFYTEYRKKYNTPTFYGEIYYHYEDPADQDISNVDWALIYCPEAIWDTFGYDWWGYCVIEDKVVYQSRGVWPEIPYAIYEKKRNKFVNIVDVNPADYPGLSEAITVINTSKQIGDIDGDKKLSVIDATVIQQALAGVVEFPVSDACEVSEDKDWRARGLTKLNYFSDFDKDGERTVMDATAIQMHLAGLDVTA